MDEFSHGSHGIFDRDCGIYTMLVVEIDVVDAKTCQGLIAAGFDVFWAATDVHAAIIAFEGKFGRKNHFVAPISDGTSNKTLIVPIAVDIGCVEKEDIKFNGSVDCFDGFVLVRGSVLLGHTHAAQAEGGYG